MPTPIELCQAAIASGMKNLGLTDTTLAGSIEFYDTCNEMGIKPILGLDLPVQIPQRAGFPANSRQPANDCFTISLYATGIEGWANLCHLSSIIYTERQEAIGCDTLQQYRAGLVCLPGGRQSAIQQAIIRENFAEADRYLNALVDIFGTDVYLDVSFDPECSIHTYLEFQNLAKRYRVPITFSHPVFYITPDQERIQRVLSAIRCNKNIDGLEACEVAPSGSYFKSSSEMQVDLQDIPFLKEGLQTLSELSERCRFELPVGKSQFPKLDLPENLSPDQVLSSKAHERMTELYPDMIDQTNQRLEHELAVIRECGYAPLFLIMQEIVTFARENGIPIASRGSASSSLVAHCLGITTPDPIRLNLYFERFLNPYRKTPPDIDTDICSRNREKVIQFVYQHYGADRVAMVSTINRFRRRSALHDVARVYGMPENVIKKWISAIPDRWYGPSAVEDSPREPYSDLSALIMSDLHKEVIGAASAMIGLPRHWSVHPGGLVISPGPMHDIVPTAMATKGIVITQFDLQSIERLGLIKIDLLGIKGLTVLGDVAEDAKQHTGYSGLNQVDFLEQIPEVDQKTSELLSSARTIGCFQIESPGMRATLKEIRAKTIDDLIVALALYRPGPLTGGLKSEFVSRYLNRTTLDNRETLGNSYYLDPSLASILKETYGVILYQEQVLRIAYELAGFNLAEADLLRSAMSHFDPGKQMANLKQKFIEGANSRNNIEQPIAERIWDLMAAFAGYGFPKAHASSYAVVAWRSAWCKSHFPAIFITAILRNWGGYYRQNVYISEARRMGCQVKPPHINFSKKEFSLVYLSQQPVLFVGLNQVRDLTHRTQQKIESSQPFSSFTDFLTRVDPKPIEANNLIRCGAMEGLGKIPDLLNVLQQGGWKSKQLPLFSFESGIPDTHEDWPQENLIRDQNELLGAYVSAHPLELFSEQIKKNGAVNTAQAAGMIGNKIRIAGTRQAWRRFSNRSGETSYNMILEDMEGYIDVHLSQSIYRKFQSDLKTSGPFIVEGDVMQNKTTNEAYLDAERVYLISRI